MIDLKTKAKRLGFHGMAAHWDEYANEPWLGKLFKQEEEEKALRSFTRRVKEAKIGEFKPLSEFDWTWPKEVDRELVEELFTFKFLEEKANVIFIGDNGLGKSMLAQNLAYQSLVAGHDARFVKASILLDELSQCDGAHARKRCLRKYSAVDLLVVDEIGYMRYGDDHADLLYEVLTARYPHLSTIVTTNKTFQEWGQVFPNAAPVVTLVDRLVHKAEIVVIKGDSYRAKEAAERAALRTKKRKEKQAKKKGGKDNNDESSSAN
jgi:DNA replication protein DnaC